MENIKKLIQEITICQLSESEYKFRCAVCGKTHKASSSKSISKCLSSLEALPFDGITAEKIYFNERNCFIEVFFPQITINTLLPGIPVGILYEKSEDLISFLKDYYSAFFEDSSIFIDKYSNRIWYSSYYKYELPAKKPYLLLVKEFEQYASQYISADYKKILQKNIEESKKFLNDVAHAIIDHIDLFTCNNSNLNDKSATGIEFTGLEAKIREISAKVQQVKKDIPVEEIINLICQLIGSYYCIYNSGYNGIKDIKETSDYFSCSTQYGAVYTSSKKIRKPEMRILIAVENKYSTSRYTAAEKQLLQLLIDEIAREILPIEDAVQKALDAASS